MDVRWNWVAYRKDCEVCCPASDGVGPAGEVLDGFLMQFELFECHSLILLREIIFEARLADKHESVYGDASLSGAGIEIELSTKI